MSRLELRSLSEADMPTWCRAERAPSRRQRCSNELKALFRSGASEPSLLWWLREDGSLLARLLLVREASGLAIGFLELPWQGAWRSPLKRLLQAVIPALTSRGFDGLAWAPECLGPGAVSAISVAEVLMQSGFVLESVRCLARVEQVRPIHALPEGGLPPGAEIDGAGGGNWDLSDPPQGAPPPADLLRWGLGLMAARGAREVQLQWKGPLPDEQETAGLWGPDWRLLELRESRRLVHALRGETR